MVFTGIGKFEMKTFKERKYKYQREYLEEKNKIEFSDDLEILIERHYKEIKPERILDIF